MARHWRVAWLAGIVGAVAVLWVFPLVLFPHPATNEAIVLSNLELVVLLLGFGGLVAVLVMLRQRATVIRVGLGVFLLGAAVDFFIGIFAFGNFQNDRFLPLLFLPFPIGAGGFVALVVGFVLGPMSRPDLLRGAALGLPAAAFVCAWMLVRGARDWLLAPYGFDVLVLIVVVGAAIVVVGRPESARG